MEMQGTPPSFIERYFKIREKGSTVRTELLAGMTTFIAMAYILFVNPNILADAGIPKDAAIASTIWIAALASMAMGVFANYPVALAPGMGLNAFFAYYVCGVLGLHWTVALGAVFFSGVLFLILTVGGIRQAIINAVPRDLKLAISVGIGLFIAFIGLKGTGLIVENSATYVSLGHVTAPTSLLSLFGLLFTAALMARNVHGSILIGIFVTTILAMVLGMTPAPQGIGDIISTSLPHMGETFGQLDLAGAWNYGTSTVTSYIESAAGIAAGGRTGLTALAAGVLFLAALLFTPLIGLVPAFATAPALILVGALLMSEVGKIDFGDFTNALPAFLTIIMMPLTSSIANGFAFGFISYTIMKLFAGQYKKVSWIMYLVSIAFLINLALRS